MGKSCLVISPFLPRADDAGHRKRTYESCQLLADLGYELTLLHLAFEGNWYWRKQLVNQEELRGCGITSYLEFYADGFVGRRPLNGAQVHLLDEWWDSHFEAYLCNHLHRNFYDVVIIHNVWLSKAFDFFPHFTIKLIETHDLFSERSSQFEKIQATPDFYSCSEADEIFGLKRSHVAIAIKPDDAKWIEGRLSNIDVVTVSPRPVVRRERTQSTYQSLNSVIFGFIGSAHLFNLHCLTDFLTLLKTELLRNPIAIEIVLAGNICEYINTEQFPFVKKLGYVKRVEEFYSGVDFIFSPLDYGTGLKLKVAEAIEYGVPIISTEHSAAGIALDKILICTDKRALVTSVMDITINRPSYSIFIEAVRASKLRNSESYQNSRAAISDCLNSRIKHFVLDYEELTLPATHPLFAAALSTIRLFCGQGRVTLLSTEENISIVGNIVSKMPANVDVICCSLEEIDNSTDFLFKLDDKKIIFTEGVIFISSKINRFLRDASVTYFDSRLHAVSEKTPTAKLIGLVNVKDQTRVVLPLYSSSLHWDSSFIRPTTFKSVGTSLIVRLSHEHSLAAIQYLNNFYPNIEIFEYESDDDLINKVSSWIVGKKLSKKIVISSCTTAVEKCITEYLKMFGGEVSLYKNIKESSQAESPYNHLINTHDSEADLTQKSINLIFEEKTRA